MRTTFNYNGKTHFVDLVPTSAPYRIDTQTWMDFGTLKGSWNAFAQCWDIGVGETGLTEEKKREFVAA